MNLPEEIENKLGELTILCNEYMVAKLFIFGSASKGNFNPQNSDIDFIVELEKTPPVEKGESLMKLWTELEQLFSKKVDLLTPNSLKNPFLIKEIENSKVLLYDRAS